MHFLKTLFWVIAAIILATFAHANWTQVTIALWAGMVMETKLPVIVIASILLGFLPTYIVLRATRWRMQRRVDSIERAIVPPPSADPVPVAPSAADPLIPSES